ncbi:hypothetical protein [Pseudomonas xanthosomatis]|uniref:hypothetical protein n=1 Tax=Pseudomonas xanthosomatis TaxID=2842356 RepID=UPI00351333A7
MDRSPKKNLIKIRCEILEILRKLKTEIPLPLLQGAIPVILFSNTEDDVDAILGSLLAGGQLIKYSCYLLAPYAVVLIARFALRLSFDSSREKLEYIHDLISEVGNWFLTISRTAVGAAMGCLALVHTTDIITATPSEIVRTYYNVTSLLLLNCALVFFKDHVFNKINPKRPQNPYKINKYLR